MIHARDQPAPEAAFLHRVTVIPEDIDVLGHANNVVYLRWLQEAAAAHSVAVGLDLPAYRALGCLWVVRRHEIEYLASAQLGEVLTVATWIESHRGATAQRRTQIRRDADGRLLARAETTWVLVQLPSGRPTRVPAELAARYTQPTARRP